MKYLIILLLIAIPVYGFLRMYGKSEGETPPTPDDDINNPPTTPSNPEEEGPGGGHVPGVEPSPDRHPREDEIKPQE